MRSSFSRFLSLGLLILLATGCAAIMENREEIAKRIAHPAWMVKREIPADPFALTAFERVHKNNSEASLYIEGDGLAWLSRTEVSLDPTPKNPVALHLAAMDKSQNVIYLARPCQYSKLTNPSDGPCADKYWTSHRYGDVVLASYNSAMNEIKRRYGITQFHLTGFSGGGAIASLLAAQRSDVASLRTVAGNLDHVAHSDYHGVSRLNGSLNAVDVAEKLRSMPQRHFIGGQDTIVPPAVFYSYRDAIGDTPCLHYTLIQQANHQQGWANKWPELLAMPIACKGPVPTDFDEEKTIYMIDRYDPSKPSGK